MNVSRRVALKEAGFNASDASDNQLTYEPLTEDEKEQIISSFEGMPPAIRGSARKMIDAILETLPNDDDNLRTYGKRKE